MLQRASFGHGVEPKAAIESRKAILFEWLLLRMRQTNADYAFSQGVRHVIASSRHGAEDSVENAQKALTEYHRTVLLRPYWGSAWITFCKQMAREGVRAPGDEVLACVDQALSLAPYEPGVVRNAVRLYFRFYSPVVDQGRFPHLKPTLDYAWRKERKRVLQYAVEHDREELIADRLTDGDRAQLKRLRRERRKRQANAG